MMIELSYWQLFIAATGPLALVAIGHFLQYRFGRLNLERQKELERNHVIEEKKLAATIEVYKSITKVHITVLNYRRTRDTDIVCPKCPDTIENFIKILRLNLLLLDETVITNWDKAGLNYSSCVVNFMQKDTKGAEESLAKAVKHYHIGMNFIRKHYDLDEIDKIDIPVL